MTIQRSSQTFRVLAVCTIVCFGAAQAFASESSSAVWMTGKTFSQELDRTFSASWTREELRQVLAQVSTDRRISILLDRRLNSSLELALNVSNVSLQEGLAQFAALANGELSLPGNVVYLGPKSAARRLRTLIELRKRDLLSKEARIPERRRSELQRTKSFEWHDLDTPREVLAGVTEKWGLKLSNVEIIPHDLWAGATLPDVSAVEALSLILIQFDLTFKWVESAAAIELVPIPESIAIEKKYRPKQKLTETVAMIRRTFPETRAEISNADILVQGMIEDHDGISNLLAGNGTKRSLKVEQPLNLQERRFTLRTGAPIPVIKLMETLEESKIHFEYNREEFQAAEIDLDQMIDINVKDVTADEFFKSIFEPVGLVFQIDRLTVKLTPRRPKNSKN